jgi:hypothetical protein
LVGALTLRVSSITLLDLKVSAFGLHFSEGTLLMLGTWEGGGLDVVQLIDLIEFIVKDVVEFGVLQDVVPLVMQPRLPFLHVPRHPLLLLLHVHSRPILIFVVFLYNCHCFGRGFFTPTRETTDGGLFEGVKFSHFLLEAGVVLLEFAQLAAEGVLLLRGALVDALHEEVVVQSQP